MTRPEYCILPMIAGAVIGGATVIDVRERSEQNSLSITFNGQIWTYQDFPDLLSSKDRVAREFQLGLSAAQSLEPREVVFRSRFRGIESKLSVVDGNPSSSHRHLADESDEFNVISIERCKLAFQSSLYELIAQRCCYCPRVAWMGRRLIRKSPAETAGRLQLEAPDISSPAIVLSAWTAATVTEAGCSGHIWTTERDHNEFTFVINGIAYPKRVRFGSYKGFYAVIAAPNLQLDISRENVVEDQAFTHLIEHLKNLVDTQLMPRLKRSCRLMMPLQREVAERFLKHWRP